MSTDVCGDTSAIKSHSCQRAEDLHYGCQRLCCYLKTLYWWWWSYTDTVHHGQCWLWERVFPFSMQRIISFSLTAKPRKNSTWSWTNGLEQLTLQCWQCVCVWVRVCTCVFFFCRGGTGDVCVSESGGYIVSWLSSPPSLPATHSFILWTTGTGRTWWILAWLASTSRWTQSGWKEPLKPTNASLSAGRPNYIKAGEIIWAPGCFSAMPCHIHF